MKCVQGRRSKIGGRGAERRLVGSKRQQISNFVKPWQESHWRKRGECYRYRDSQSGIHRKVVIHGGKKEFWYIEGII